MIHQGEAEASSARETSPSGPFLTTLPVELIERILGFVLSTGSVTTYQSTAENIELGDDILQPRKSLSSTCQASRQLAGIANRWLYRHVILKNIRELLCFFRTLASRPELRGLVHSFAWVGSLTGPGFDIPMMSMGRDMESLALDCCDSTNWPATEEDRFLALLMHLVSPEDFHAWNTLGAVLAMLSRVKVLFLLLGKVPGRENETNTRDYPSCLEHDGINRLLDTLSYPYYTTDDQCLLPGVVTPPDHDGMIAPSATRFLQELETVIIEPPEDTLIQWYFPGMMLRSILQNSRFLRRVELKGHTSISPIVKSAQEEPDNWMPPVIGENVRELFIFRGFKAHQNMQFIPAAFPYLQTLVVEVDDGSIDYWFLPVGLSGYNFSEELGYLRETLEALQVTTVSGKTWETLDIPPLLSPTLAQMTMLKHLTTESIWLFGRENPSFSLQIASILPSSLVSFRLIDYWGTADPDNFYPQFENSITPLDFWDRFFSVLCQGCETPLVHLRNVTIISPSLCFVGGETAVNRDEQRKTEAFVDKFLALFLESGVRFSVSGPEDWTRRMQSSWANMA